MLAPGLNDSFSEEGFWWLDGDKDNKVAGTLTFDPDGGPVLRVLGMLRDVVTSVNAACKGDDGEMVTIHGVTKKGKRVTLLRAFSTNRQLNMPGIANEEWHSNLLLVGWHISNSDEAIFSKSYIRFQEIERWLEHKPFMDTFNREEKTVTLVAAKPREVSFAKHHEFEVTTVGSLYSSNDPPTRFTIDVYSQMGITPEEPRSLDWHFARATRLQELAALCAGFYLPLLSLELRGPEEELGGGGCRPCEVHVYARIQHPEGDKWRKHDAPIVSGPELVTFNPEAVQAWFDQYELFGPAIALFFTITGQRQMFTNIRFILAIQALEVFHRRTSDETVIDEADFPAFRDELAKSIPASAPTSMRERLERSYQFVNELSLNQRLKAIVKQVTEDFGARPPAFSKAYLKTLVDTRNYYTHFSKELEKEKLDGVGMYWASRRVILLLTVLFLMRLGISAKDIATLLERHSEFARLWKSEGTPV